MAAFVLDASVAISWCFPSDSSENTPYNRAVLEHIAEADAVVPEIWAFEIANGILSRTISASGSLSTIFANTFGCWRPFQSAYRA
jgi:hypothetical protein